MSIFNSEEDFDLCDKVWNALSEHAINVDDCCGLERVVRLVWDSLGLIGNGGLHRLFEGDYPGDPGFVYTVAAYKRIGANAAYEALQDTFRLFPGGSMPTDLRARLQLLESVSVRKLEEIESRYYDADSEIVTCLAQFIRENENGYQALLNERTSHQAPIHPHLDSRDAV